MILPKIDHVSDLSKLPWKYIYKIEDLDNVGAALKPYFKWIIDISNVWDKYKCLWHSDVMVMFNLTI